jgi:hypothetical protein
VGYVSVGLLLCTSLLSEVSQCAGTSFSLFSGGSSVFPTFARDGSGSCGLFQYSSSNGLSGIVALS